MAMTVAVVVAVLVVGSKGKGRELETMGWSEWERREENVSHTESVGQLASCLR